MASPVVRDSLFFALRKHALWLHNKPGGERADFAFSYLKGIEIPHVDLRKAKLAGANMSSGNLEGDKLGEADLCKAVLTK